MNWLIFLSFVFAASMIMTSCETRDAEVNPRSALEKSWTQSYEEQTSEEIEIFRPSDSKDFSPSRFRQIFHFEENNVFEYLILAPNDGHYMGSGIWQFDEKTNILKIINSDSELIYEFEVLELTYDLLKLRAIK